VHESEMGAAAHSVVSAPERRSARRILLLFAILGIVGVVLLAFYFPLGLVVLIAAEVFFVMAYRRFARRSQAAG
jgi:uncharacterized membrane protein